MEEFALELLLAFFRAMGLMIILIPTIYYMKKAIEN